MAPATLPSTAASGALISRLIVDLYDDFKISYPTNSMASKGKSLNKNAPYPAKRPFKPSYFVIDET